MASISRIACLAWKRKTQTNKKRKIEKDKLQIEGFIMLKVTNFRVFYFVLFCFFQTIKFNFWTKKYCWHCHFLLVFMLHTLHTLRRILKAGAYWSLSSEHHKKTCCCCTWQVCLHSGSGKGGPCTHGTHWDGEFLKEVVMHTSRFQPPKTTFFFKENKLGFIRCISQKENKLKYSNDELTCLIFSECSSVIFHQVSRVDYY